MCTAEGTPAPVQLPVPRQAAPARAELNAAPSLGGFGAVTETLICGRLSDVRLERGWLSWAPLVKLIHEDTVSGSVLFVW